MNPGYRHTQTNWATTAVMALSAALAGTMLWSAWSPSDGSAPLSVGAQSCILLYFLGIVAAWLLAYRLTIELDTFSLRWRIGVGALRDSYALSEIESANPVATPFSFLPRVRRAGLTRMVSVAPGRRAVELVMSDGRRVVLGTNDSDGLLAAIEAAKDGARPHQ